MSKATDYHRALLLNNLGVLLLDRGNYKKAACAFKDSLNAMKQIFYDASPKSSRSLDLAHKMQRLRKHIQPLISSGELSNSLTFWNNRIAMGDQDQIAFGSLRSVVITIPESPAAFVSMGRDPQLEMAVIFSNAGIAFFRLSSVRPSSSSPKSVPMDVQEHAMSMMSLASKLVSERFALCDDMDEESRLMSVALVVTGNTTQLHQEAGRSLDAKAYGDKYQRMCMAIR
jgi:hypothetical protein